MDDKFKLIIAFSLYFLTLIVADGDGSGGEFLLCGHCFHRVAPLSHINYVKSPYAIKTWNASLFESNNTHQSLRPDEYSVLYKTIQLVENPMKIRFQLVTVTASHAVDVFLLEETASLDHTWFPGFRWTICLCPKCFTHLGWHFQSVFGKIENSEDFLALILDKLAYNGRFLFETPIRLFKNM